MSGGGEMTKEVSDRSESLSVKAELPACLFRMGCEMADVVVLGKGAVHILTTLVTNSE